MVILSASFLCFFLFIYHPSFPMRKLGLDPFKVFLFVVLLILKVWDYEQWSTSCCLPTIKNQTIGFENRYDQISSCWLSLMCLCFSSLTHLFIYYFFCSDRIIFAVKEASLLDQGSQGKQSIYQLEQVKRMSYFEEMLIKYGLIFLIFVIKFFELFFFVHHHYPQVHCIHGYCSKEQLLVDLGCIMGFFFSNSFLIGPGDFPFKSVGTWEHSSVLWHKQGMFLMFLS